MTTSNNGICILCKENIEHRSMVKHINKCLENSLNDASSKEKLFLIKIFAGKSFWLYLEINGSSTLEILDSFLRDTWLECCGHMSQFDINSESYSSDGEMQKVIHRVLDVGVTFDYEYDFGSTTQLKGKVISTRPGKLLKEIRLLAQNNLPEEIQCSICQKHPEAICSVCYDFFCKKCRRKHDNCEGEECMLPVVNSPRMGVCGYEG
jgi:hypothetical protein